MAQSVEKRIDQARGSGSSFRINDINIRNREFQKKIEDDVGERKLKQEIESSAGRVKTADPFTRLPVRPVIYWDVNIKKREAEEAAAAKAAAASSASRFLMLTSQ